MLNVVCLKTGTKYDDRYVPRLKNMVERHLKVPHNFICFTDKPIEGITCYEPPTIYPGWWGKVGFFRENLPIDGPFLYIDLDMIIVNDILPLFIDTEDFVLIKQWKNLKPNYKAGKICSAYNSSVMYFKEAGVRPDVFNTLSKEAMDKWRGDQDWIAVCNPNEVTYPSNWFQAFEQIKGGRPASETKIVICNVHDPHTVENVPWVKETWI